MRHWITSFRLLDEDPQYSAARSIRKAGQRAGPPPTDPSGCDEGSIRSDVPERQILAADLAWARAIGGIPPLI